MQLVNERPCKFNLLNYSIRSLDVNNNVTILHELHTSIRSDINFTEQYVLEKKFINIQGHINHIIA